MFSRFKITPTRSAIIGKVTDNWLVTCTTMPEGTMYFINRKDSVILHATWKEQGDFNVNGIYNLKDTNLPALGYLFPTDEWFEISDITVGLDCSRIYTTMSAQTTIDNKQFFDTNVLCLDIQNSKSKILESFTIVPTWNMQDITRYVNIQSLSDIRNSLHSLGLGTHSYNSVFSFTHTTVLSYNGYVYVCVPLFFTPLCSQLNVLYAFNEHTHESIGVGIFGELTTFFQQNFVRPLKTNMTVIDDTIVFRADRTAKIIPAMYKDRTLLNQATVALSAPPYSYIPIIKDDTLNNYYKQPYTTTYINVQDLHTQLEGSSIKTPVILNGTELFNAQILSSSEYSDIVIDHSWRRMYTTVRDTVYEYDIDFLLIEVYFGNRWVSMESLVFPYLKFGDGEIKIKIKNGARYAKLVNINLTITSPYYSLPTNSIPQLNPQEELILPLTFSNPTAIVIRDILRYSYAVYI